MVAVATLAEWLGLMFNGNKDVPVELLKTVKFFDYLLTPVVGGIVILQFKKSIKVITYAIYVILGINFIFQFISLFTNWMIVIDTEHVYSHGQLYYLYIALYFLIILLVVIDFAIYGTQFKRQNRASLYGVLVFVTAGIAFQIAFDVRTAYVAITIGLIVLFIHNSEFSQQIADDQIEEQKILITIDPLTGISNRYAYERDLSSVELKEDFVVFSIDINGLKNTNDTKGHQAGDELICAAASVISEVFNKYGKCYRTGGDEFIALSYVPKGKIDEVVEELNQKSDAWKGEKVDKLSLSVGSASKKEFPDITIDELVYNADYRMYKNKSQYYLAQGIDRRKV